MSHESHTEISLSLLNQLDKNEFQVTNAAKAAEDKFNAVNKERNKILQSITELKNRISLLDNKIYNYNSEIPKLEKEIEEVVKETEDVAVSTELIKWQQTKVKMVNDFEKEITNDQHRAIDEYKRKYEAQTKANSSSSEKLLTTKAIEEENCKKEKLQAKVNDLLQEIEHMKQKLSATDKDKLQQEIQMLQNRNSAIQVRLRRQIQEAEARHRQKLSLLLDLKKIYKENMGSLSKKELQEKKKKK